MANLYFRYGAMNSGKTSSLLQVAHNYDEIDKKCIVIKPLVDTKGGTKVESRIGIKREVDYVIDKKDNIIEKLKPILKGLDIIIVDEAQFLTRKNVEELYTITKVLDIPVMCYGLKTDFRSELFVGSKRLLELADKIEEITTICKCGSKARFNARKYKGEFVYEGNQVVIDGEEEDITYESLCGKCYLEKVLGYNLTKERNKMLSKR